MLGRNRGPQRPATEREQLLAQLGKVRRGDLAETDRLLDALHDLDAATLAALESDPGETPAEPAAM